MKEINQQEIFDDIEEDQYQEDNWDIMGINDISPDCVFDVEVFGFNDLLL